MAWICEFGGVMLEGLLKDRWRSYNGVDRVIIITTERNHIYQLKGIGEFMWPTDQRI